MSYVELREKQPVRLKTAHYKAILKQISGRRHLFPALKGEQWRNERTKQSQYLE